MDKNGAAEKPLILVVEDNPVELLMVERMLAGAGFRTVGAGDGESGIALALSHEPDLILLDALLPDIDGFDVCARLQADPRSRFLPVVMLTGLDDVDSIDRAYEVGAIDFYPKPINRSLLVHRLRYLLRTSRANEELRHSRQSLASAQRVARLGHWEYDFDRGRATLSDELIQLYGLTPEAVASGCAALLDACHVEDRPQLRETLQHMLAGGDSARIEHRLVPRNGDERVMEMHLARVDDDDGGGQLLVGTCMEITARKESEREILRLAYFDRLTGLPNRSLLETALEQMIPAAHRQGCCLALMVIDIDLFSRVNNALGNGAGDAVLCQLGQRLAQVVSAPAPQQQLKRLSLSMPPLEFDLRRGLVARLGADVFVVVVGLGEDEQALTPGVVAPEVERVRAQLQQPFSYRGQEIFITASVGLGRSDVAATPAQTLLQQADMALREAKRHGHNEARGYRQVMEQQVATQLRLQSDLRRALRRDELQLYFQPKVAVQDGAVTGFEALLRWHHPTRGMVSPVEFISVAEETGQIVELGRWVLLAACEQFRQWLEQGLVHGRISVNISARQLREPDLVATVREVLAQARLPSRHLELEITEGVLMSDPQAADVVAALRGQGISVALDDFGTGFSSLSYLTRFPIDTIKIDRCFVSGIIRYSEQEAIVTAVTTLSHQLQLKVVAEGVETEAELKVISELNCDEIQGFLACQPLPGEAAGSWLRLKAQSRSVRSLL